MKTVGFHRPPTAGPYETASRTSDQLNSKKNKMKKNNFRAGLLAIVMLAVVWIGFWAFSNKQIGNMITSETATTTIEGTTTSEPESVQDIKVKDAVVIKPVTISYANALVTYADRRIQLDKICQAHPNTVTYKDNTGIMIDNRSPKTRTVKIGETFTIKPYGFKIIVLPDVYLKSKTILVDCDASQNVATILIQE